MEIHIDCFPCWARQVVEAAKISTNDKELQKRIMRESFKIISNAFMYTNSPELVRDFQIMVKDLTGNKDPYKEIKEKSIKLAFKVMPLIRDYLKKNQYSIYSVLKVAAVGNIMDAAAYGDKFYILEDIIEKELEKPFTINSIDIFEKRLKSAKNMLIIGDNAGESVLDNILAEKFSNLDIIYAVRDSAMINDVTYEDAIASGLDKNTKIISTGSDIAGIMLDRCSDEFVDTYYNADIVILKGMGNFETLDKPNREAFYLLKVKCDSVAKNTNTKKDNYLFLFKK